MLKGDLSSSSVSSQHKKLEKNRKSTCGTNYLCRLFDKEHFCKLFMGSSFSGSAYNYCASPKWSALGLPVPRMEKKNFKKNQNDQKIKGSSTKRI